MDPATLKLIASNDQLLTFTADSMLHADESALLATSHFIRKLANSNDDRKRTIGMLAALGFSTGRLAAKHRLATQGPSPQEDSDC